MNLFDYADRVQEESLNSYKDVISDMQNTKLVEDFTFGEFS